MISGCTSYADTIQNSNARLIDCAIFGNNIVKQITNGPAAPTLYLRTSIGTRYSGANNGTMVEFSGPVPVILQDCPFDVTGMTLSTGLTSCGDSTYIQLLNKGDGTATGISAAVQEIYRKTSNTVPVLVRDASVYSNATSSLRVCVS